MEKIDLGRIGKYIGIGYSDGSIGIICDDHIHSIGNLKIPASTLLYFLMEFQKSYPIKLYPTTDWQGLYGLTLSSSEDNDKEEKGHVDSSEESS